MTLKTILQHRSTNLSSINKVRRREKVRIDCYSNPFALITQLNSNKIDIRHDEEFLREKKNFVEMNSILNDKSKEMCKNEQSMISVWKSEDFDRISTISMINRALERRQYWSSFLYVSNSMTKSKTTWKISLVMWREEQSVVFVEFSSLNNKIDENIFVSI